jgi:hypothetical protein
MLPFYFIMVATMMTTMPRGQASPEDMSAVYEFVLWYRNDFLRRDHGRQHLCRSFLHVCLSAGRRSKLSGLDAIKLSIKGRQS